MPTRNTNNGDNLTTADKAIIIALLLAAYWLMIKIGFAILSAFLLPEMG